MPTFNNQNLHRELTQTIARRKQLFELYEPFFADDNSTDIRSILQQTIREHKRAMYLLQNKAHTIDSKKSA